MTSDRLLPAAVAVCLTLGIAACGSRSAGTEGGAAVDAGVDTGTAGSAAVEGESGGAGATVGPGTGGEGSRARGGPVDLSKLPAGAIALRRVDIQDPGVIANGTALTALVPAGWATRGGITAGRACTEPFLVDWTASSPDGRSGLAIFPTEVWRWSTFPMGGDCPVAVLRTAREYLQARVQRMFPGARPLDYRDRPDFTKSATEQAQRLNQMMAGLGLSARAEGGELLFAFERDGVDMRGVMGVTAMFQGGSVPNPMDGSRMEQMTGSTLGTFMAYAPNGALDFDLVEAARRSVTPDAKWLEKLFALQAQLGQINAQATRERAAIIVAGGAEATRRNIATFEQMAQSSVRNSQEALARTDQALARGENFPGDLAGDRMQRETIEGIRGVETYRDPVGGHNVQLDANYDHAWRVNSQDTYILTKDPNFNPGAYGIEATQMGVVQ